MKNLTLSIDEALLRNARQVAAQRSMSLNAMIRSYLQELVEQESRTAQARRRIGELCRASETGIGPRTWTRDELHER